MEGIEAIDFSGLVLVFSLCLFYLVRKIKHAVNNATEYPDDYE